MEWNKKIRIKKESGNTLEVNKAKLPPYGKIDQSRPDQTRPDQTQTRTKVNPPPRATPQQPSKCLVHTRTHAYKHGDSTCPRFISIYKHGDSTCPHFIYKSQTEHRAQSTEQIDGKERKGGGRGLILIFK